MLHNQQEESLGFTWPAVLSSEHVCATCAETSPSPTELSTLSRHNHGNKTTKHRLTRTSKVTYMSSDINTHSKSLSLGIPIVTLPITSLHQSMEVKSSSFASIQSTEQSSSQVRTPALEVTESFAMFTSTPVITLTVPFGAPSTLMVMPIPSDASSTHVSPALPFDPITPEQETDAVEGSSIIAEAVGGIIGSFVLLVILACLWFYRKRHRPKHDGESQRGLREDDTVSAGWRKSGSTSGSEKRNNSSKRNSDAMSFDSHRARIAAAMNWVEEPLPSQPPPPGARKFNIKRKPLPQYIQKKDEAFSSRDASLEKARASFPSSGSISPLSYFDVNAPHTE